MVRIYKVGFPDESKAALDFSGFVQGKGNQHLSYPCLTRFLALLLLALCLVPPAAARPAGSPPAAAEALIALTLRTCPWVPEPIPYLYLLSDEQWFGGAIVQRIGSERNVPTKHVWGYYTKHSWLGRQLEYIALRGRTANERFLCHEWRHAVEGDWHD